MWLYFYYFFLLRLTVINIFLLYANRHTYSYRYSIIHSSFILGLIPSSSANPSYRSLSFSFFRFHYMDSPDCLLLLLAYPSLLFSFFSVLHCFVVVSVRWIKLTHVGFWAHVKIASRVVSYRKFAVESNHPLCFMCWTVGCSETP